MPLTLVLLAQGIYYLVTGIWPLVHIPSFMAVTGDKVDLWLVRTVGAMVTAIAVALLSGLWLPYSPVLAVLGIASAVAFLAIDLIYVARKVIGPVYLVDAVAQVVLIAGWAAVLLSS